MVDSLRPSHWPYRADIPQRWFSNADLYAARGGRVRLAADAARFAVDGDNGDISRLFFFSIVQDQLQKERLEGDIAEVGVYKGATASVLAEIARRHGARLWLFDTFDGFAPEDLKGVDADQALAQFTDTSLEFVRKRVGEQSVVFVKGRFPDSTSQIDPGLRFCLVHLDCDLYEPMSAALNYFYPRMVPGGFIIMHDYSSFAWRGAERAIDEFFVDKPESVTPLTDSCGSCVVRRIRDPIRDPHWTVGRFPFGRWIEAGTDGIGIGLAEGWSGAEPWGVWGVGNSHALRLPPMEGPVRLEVDCSAALLGRVTWQGATVSLQGRQLDGWEFTSSCNRAVRSVLLPRQAGPLTVTFDLAEPTLRPCDVDPSASDDRRLGLAVFQIRLTDPSAR